MMQRRVDKKTFHVCDAMPEGSVIELCEVYFTQPAEFIYFCGLLKVTVKHCPFCGVKLEKEAQ